MPRPRGRAAAHTGPTTFSIATRSVRSAPLRFAPAYGTAARQTSHRQVQLFSRRVRIDAFDAVEAPRARGDDGSQRPIQPEAHADQRSGPFAIDAPSSTSPLAVSHWRARFCDTDRSIPLAIAAKPAGGDRMRIPPLAAQGQARAHAASAVHRQFMLQRRMPRRVVIGRTADAPPVPSRVGPAARRQRVSSSAGAFSLRTAQSTGDPCRHVSIGCCVTRPRAPQHPLTPISNT